MLSTRSAAPKTPSWGEFWPETPIRIAIDPNGNLTQKTENGEVWDYVWNAENQLIRVCKDLTPPQTCDSDGVAIASFKYDAMGRRIERASAGSTWKYLHDFEDILRQASAGSTLLFIHGDDTDEPLAVDMNGTINYYHADAQASVVAMSDSAGGVATTLKYEVFGALQGGSPVTYAYTGREWDPATGLYYYRARYYDPTQGRFLSEDPIAFSGGMNFYTYVANNPATFVDPLGLCPPSPEMIECLKKIFPDDPVEQVKVIHDPKRKPKFSADTRKNKIRVFIDCDVFWEDPELVLEEYFHVLKHWPKKFFKIRYGANSVAKFLIPGQHYYHDNKYEKEAKAFAKSRKGDLEDCLGCPVPK